MPCFRASRTWPSRSTSRNAGCCSLLVGPASVYCECRALRIEALGNAVAAGDLHRAVQDLSAELLDALHRRIGVGDPDVVEPVRWHGHVRGLGPHAAVHRLTVTVHLVHAGFAHVEVARLLPTEEL